MGRPTRRVVLSPDERSELEALCRAGVGPKRPARRAQMLLWADDGKQRQEIAGLLHASRETVRRILDRYLEEGLAAALADRPRPGGTRRLDGKQEALVVALACSAAPEGRQRWTLRLLADKVVELGLSEQMSYETIRRVLKKTNSSRGKPSSGASLR
jgi:transposase